jgi:hypothetical protein
MITIVTGLPRSGTSMMMQLLSAGGITLLSDNLRKADINNPKGYYEFEPVKRIKEDASWLGQAEGRAVKIIAQLVTELPPELPYRIIFMRRNIEEVVLSQNAMLKRLQKTGGGLEPERLRAIYRQQVEKAEAFLRGLPKAQVCSIEYASILRSPESYFSVLEYCTGKSLDRVAMRTIVDPRLHRQLVVEPGSSSSSDTFRACTVPSFSRHAGVRPNFGKSLTRACQFQ